MPSKPTAKASRNHQPWTDADLDFLRANYGKLSLTELYAALGRGPCALYPIILRLKLHRYWTAEEDQFLRDNRHEKWGWCAKQLNRTIVSVRSRAARLGCVKPQLKPPDLERLKLMHAQGFTARQIGNSLDCAGWTVSHWLQKLNLLPNKRCETSRMRSLERSLWKNHGVKSLGQLNHRRKVQARRAVVAVQIETLRKALEAACPS